MQYNHYPSVAHHTHPTSHPPQGGPSEYASSYPDSPLSYAAVTPANHMPAGSIAHQNISTQYPYQPYVSQSPSDNHRSYYATSSQGSAIEHYSPASSPTSSSYAPVNPSSSHLGQQSSRHHPHPSQQSHHEQQQQQQRFIATPCQTFQVYSSAGESASPARSRPAVEPYYSMSPNPQHVVHASTHASSGTGGRSSCAAHGPGSSPQPHPHGHPHPNHAHGTGGTHTGTIVVAAGERYPCDLCDRSFTRQHDRRRHYETVHATSPVLHKCRFCRKDFSRADSLKRHVDNGCDEMHR